MSNKIYILEQTNSPYGEFYTVPVLAFHSKEEADKFLPLIEEETKRVEKECDDIYEKMNELHNSLAVNLKEDEEFPEDYNKELHEELRSIKHKYIENFYKPEHDFATFRIKEVNIFKQ